MFENQLDNFRQSELFANYVANKYRAYGAWVEIVDNKFITVVIPACEIEEGLKHTEFFRLYIEDAEVTKIAWVNYPGDHVDECLTWEDELQPWMNRWVSL